MDKEIFTNPLEAMVLAVVAVIVYSLIQTGVKKLFKQTRSGEDYVTRDELVAYCQRTQQACPARSIIEIVRTGMDELRKELKAEMAEIRKLVIEVIQDRRSD